MTPAFEATVVFAPDLGAARERPQPGWLLRLLRPFRAVPSQLLDRSTRLYNRAGLFSAANEAVRARGAATPVSVVVLDCADLREVCEIYGTPIARKVVTRLVRRLRKLAGWRGLAGRTGGTEFTVVLVGATQEQALRAVQRALGRPARVEFDAGDSEIVLVPDLLVDTADADATSVHPLYREMSRELARILGDKRRRLSSLASERERHSRPMSIGSLG